MKVITIQRALTTIVAAGLVMLLGASAGASPHHPDFNGDGYADLAIGAPGEDFPPYTDAGAVHVLYGTSGGVKTLNTQLIAEGNIVLSNGASGYQIGGRFGDTLAWGDFNGDGYDDLAVGMPSFDAGAYVNGTLIPLPNVGAVAILYGSSHGLITNPVQFLVSTNLGPPLNVNQDANDQLGAALAAGDFNGDGKCDLAIGVPGQDGWNGANIVDAGEVYVVYGSLSGFKPGLLMKPGLDPTTAQGWSQNGRTIWPDIQDDPEPYDRFGAALAAGDFNGDGKSDLAIGAPGEDILGITDAGAVHVLYGRPGGLSNVGNQFWTQAALSSGDGLQSGDQFGYSLATGDFDGDGAADLAVGVPGEDVGQAANAGAVNVLYGRLLTGLTSYRNQFWHQDSAGILDVCETGDTFGLTLTTGDFNGDGRADLAVGVPGEDVLGIADAGAVNVLYGMGGLGLTPSGNQFFYQGLAGVGDVREAGDSFGRWLTTGDFNGDHRADLVIGVPRESVGGVPGAGAVHVLYGGGLGGQFWTQDSAGVPDVAEAGDGFGS